MMLAAKTALALIAAICTVLVLYGQYEIERQNGRFEAELREAQQSLGRLFRPTIARTWRTEGHASAMYAIEYTEQTLQANNIESRMTLRWVWLDDTADDHHAPAVPIEHLGPVLAGEELTTIRVDLEGERRMYSYVPLVVGIDAERPGALEVAASLAPLRAFMAQTRRTIVVAIAVLVGICAAVTLAIGTWFIGRPVSRLVGAARRIGAGDLETRVAVCQGDELGTLAREMNHMADSLVAARERVAAEAESRIQAIRQMRHADRLATVGKLASGIAHELGTPLAVVAGRAHLIGNRTATGDTAAAYAESIERQAKRMADIIRQLLDFARRRNVTLSPKDLCAIARQTLTLLGSLAQKHSVELRAELPERRLTALVDGGQIEQVLTNLVVNAIQAVPDGGVVTVGAALREAAPPADVEAEPGKYACLCVRDNGPGIPDDVRCRIFEPFFTTKPVGEGTGLGLSVSYGIARDHGGWIDVDSKLGQGTVFHLYLPRAS